MYDDIRSPNDSSAATSADHLIARDCRGSRNEGSDSSASLLSLSLSFLTGSVTSPQSRARLLACMLPVPRAPAAPALVRSLLREESCVKRKREKERQIERMKERERHSFPSLERSPCLLNGCTCTQRTEDDSEDLAESIGKEG